MPIPRDPRRLAAAAAASLPPMVHAYYAGGAEDEATLAENERAWKRLRLRPRALVDIHDTDVSTTVLGTRVGFPLLLAPAALQRLVHPDAEIGSTRAAARAGLVAVVSTTASQSLEEIAAASDGPRWFQLYAVRDRGITRDLVRRAEAAGYGAICLTVDTPLLGRRERDLRAGFRLPPDVPIANLTPYGDALAGYGGDRKDDTLTWDVVDWLRGATALPIVLKGILTAEDAVLARERGVDAVIVSNHGGRQLDGTLATAEALPEVVEAADGRMEVLVDGGIRRGADILRARALGATAALIGRPYLWALAQGGEAGVAELLEILREDLRLAMGLCGCRRVEEIRADVVTTVP